jgi:FMN phosphatase YigB (HAD superfamily)
MPVTSSRIELLVTDLDNTLWDWFDAWHASFVTLLTEVSILSGVPVPVLEDESRVVHQRRGTTEYSYLLNELPSLLALTDNPLIEYDEAVHAQNASRKTTTRLYPGVLKTLAALGNAGIPVVGYTESLAFWTEWRIATLGVDGLLTALYSSPDHDLPAGVTFDNLRTRPSEEYGLKLTPHKHVPAGIHKPSAAVLGDIISHFGATPATTLYVGDSLIKDVAMAQAVGAHDAYAAYGVAQNRPEYDLLRRVTHWTPQVVQAERDAAERAGTVTPTCVLTEHFEEILTAFDFKGAL